ncbi:unnamed protein product [Gordionus sp. m RMFG-2023]|uniref:secretagogin-like n=1 Tax=Gordionus sp. m RMFG-2023 TaxID=3053472 RepID=UPI0030E2DA96
MKKYIFGLSKIPRNTLKRLRVIFAGLTSTEFADCWNHYDVDRNGFIEGVELRNLLNDLVNRALIRRNLTEREKRKLLQEFLKEFDINKDGKLEIGELAQILEPEEGFLALVRYDMPLMNGYDFIKAWSAFTGGNKDFIPVNDVKNFINYLYQTTQDKTLSDDKLEEYAKSLVTLYDKNGDGILSFKEVSRIISPEENFMLKFKEDYHLSYRDFCAIFHHYDKNGDGVLAGNEVVAFIRDVLQTINIDSTEKAKELEKFRKIMLKACDKNRDGKFQREELALWLGVHINF